VSYKLPNGTETSESGFETKAAAQAWSSDQEARIREGRWTDPNAGKTTVSESIDRWLDQQDVGVSTEYNRDYRLDSPRGQIRQHSTYAAARHIHAAGHLRRPCCPPLPVNVMSRSAQRTQNRIICARSRQ